MKLIKILATLALMLMLTVMGGCRKRYINGDLDGQWQVMTIEYVADGHVDNVKSNQVYYAFNLHTVQLSQVKGSPSKIVGNMKYDKKSLSLDFPTIENSGTLSPWGMSSPQTTFTVEHLSSQKLIISSDFAVLTCRKF